LAFLNAIEYLMINFSGLKAMFKYHRIFIYYVITTSMIALLTSTAVIHSLLKPIDYPRYHKNYQGLNSFSLQVLGKQFNKMGQLKDIVISPKIRGYTDKNILLITKPFIKIKGSSGPPWTITAQYGKIPPKRDVVYLWGQVKIIQPPGKNSHHVTLLTKTLSYYPQKKFFYTNATATLIQPGFHITGQGMSANLKTGMVKLRHQVNAQYTNTRNSKIGF